MSTFGITSLGAYLPAPRIPRQAIADAHSWAAQSAAAEAKGEIAYCNWDEDAITTAVEAVRDCTAPQARAKIKRLIFASTSPVYADLSNTGIVASALGLGRDAMVLESTGSQRAGTSALAQALTDAVNDCVVVAADTRIGKPGSAQELRYGSGGVAIQLGREKVLASFLGAVSVTEPFVAHFRGAGRPYDYAWEERWIRDEGYLRVVPEVVNDLLRKIGANKDEVKHLITAPLLPGADRAIGRALGVAATSLPEDPQSKCGHIGAAAPLLQLAAVLERAAAGDLIIMTSFAYGCDAIAFRVTPEIAGYQQRLPVTHALRRGQRNPAYVRYLSFTNQIDIDWGMRAEGDAKTSLSQAFRAADQMTSFTAGKCVKCGAVQFPILAACVSCGQSAGFEMFALADNPAKIATVTADWLQFTPSPPFCFGLIQFECGARVLMEVVDAPPSDLDVGLPVRMVYRRKEVDRQRGYVRYFWKATPAHAKRT